MGIKNKKEQLLKQMNPDKGSKKQKSETEKQPKKKVDVKKIARVSCLTAGLFCMALNMFGQIGQGYLSIAGIGFVCIGFLIR